MATTTVAKGLPSVHDLDSAIEQITGAYHPPVRDHLARIASLMGQTAARYGLGYLNLQPLAEAFIQLEDALLSRVDEQVQRLSPSFRKLIIGRGASRNCRRIFQAAVSESKQSDQRILQLLQQIAEITDSYSPSSTASVGYSEMILDLASLDGLSREYTEAEARLLRMDGFER